MPTTDFIQETHHCVYVCVCINNSHHGRLLMCVPGSCLYGLTEFTTQVESLAVSDPLPCRRVWFKAKEKLCQRDYSQTERISSVSKERADRMVHKIKYAKLQM